jgi:hypothetical protein
VSSPNGHGNKSAKQAKGRQKSGSIFSVISRISLGRPFHNEISPWALDLENDSPTKRIEKAESSAEFAPPSLFLRIFRGPSPEFKLWLLFLGVISHV